MNSIEEKIKLLPRIRVDAKQEFVVETSIDGVTICECIVQVKQLSFNVVQGTTKIILSVYNPFAKNPEINNYEV
jgi:hypothetical protein